MTLEKDAESVRISGSDKGFTWSGMDVILPEAYAVDRWYYASDYDVYLGTEDAAGIQKQRTSRMMISPTGNAGSCITIHDDAAYTTDKLIDSVTPETIAQWGEEIAKYDGNCIVRFETAAFDGVAWEDIKAYYEDVLSMYQKHGFSWWSNDFWIMTDEYPMKHVVGGSPITSYDGFEYFNPELLELLQKYQYKN